MEKKVKAAISANELSNTAAPKSSDERTARWNSYVANYERENPVKFAAKKQNGEFSEIPASFK